MDRPLESGTGTYAATVVQKVSLIYGIVFVLVGIAGFIPGITTNIGDLSFASHESGAMLLGIFQVSVLHNMVHLLYGVLGLVFAARASWSRNYLIWGGVVYAVLWLYGLFIMKDSMANFVPLNTADDWLHFGLAVTMIGFGVFLPRTVGAGAASAPERPA